MVYEPQAPSSEPDNELRELSSAAFNELIARALAISSLKERSQGA